MSANVETMFYTRKAPWHGLGVCVESALSSEEALEKSGLNWKVIQRPIMTNAYLLQIQHYMAVTGYHGTYIAVLIGGNTFRWKFIARDEELISMLVQLEADFWEHVQSMTPPPIDGSDAAAKFLAQRFPNSISKSQTALPDHATKLIQQYDEACEKLIQLTEQKQEAENRLKEMLGENETGTIENRIVTWKTISQERLDSKTLKAEHPALYQKYANQTSYRRFSIKATI